MRLLLPETHERALAATSHIFREISPDQFSLPTPCSAWSVSDLANHVVSENCWASALVEGSTIESVGDRFGGDLIGNDPYTAYQLSAKSADAAFFRPGAMTARCAVSYGPISGSAYCQHRIIDIVIHGWDLAVATGQNSTIDPELAESCWQLVEPELANLQASGAFGDPIAVSQDASTQTRLLAALGRDVTRWT